MSAFSANGATGGFPSPSAVGTIATSCVGARVGAALAIGASGDEGRDLALDLALEAERVQLAPGAEVHRLPRSDLRQHDTPEKTILTPAVSRVVVHREHEQDWL
eukprot:CAMPEP_0179494712 /NCGR_PEP_ID=MMETSP0799-20121207/68331_1 /TAXON_ID=46947 /ORGANISM="Geminigera cryophila, Strain CCMP2564" /LENGTH=103 /DNA_ID=CAMNT_0021312375 /DNA_START=355 /DNA_END=664 /DNA_ORIENTATION=-